VRKPVEWRREASDGPARPSSLGVLNRQAKRRVHQDSRRARQQRVRLDQGILRACQPFPVAREPRLHLAETLYGPRQAARCPSSAWDAIIARPLRTIPRNATITHAAIPNSNWVAGSDIPYYTAIRFAQCVSTDNAAALEAKVQGLKSVRT
jgi:hypothetical protein